MVFQASIPTCSEADKNVDMKSILELALLRECRRSPGLNVDRGDVYGITRSAISTTGERKATSMSRRIAETSPIFNATFPRVRVISRRLLHHPPDDNCVSTSTNDDKAALRMPIELRTQGFSGLDTVAAR